MCFPVFLLSLVLLYLQFDSIYFVVFYLSPRSTTNAISWWVRAGQPTRDEKCSGGSQVGYIGSPRAGYEVRGSSDNGTRTRTHTFRPAPPTKQTPETMGPGPQPRPMGVKSFRCLSSKLPRARDVSVPRHGAGEGTGPIRARGGTDRGGHTHTHARGA